MSKAEVENNNMSSSSSDEEDGDEQWKAAINAVAATSFSGHPKPKPGPSPGPASDDDDDYYFKPQPAKHYQIKAQKVLDDILEKTLVMVKDSDPVNVNVFKDDSENVDVIEDDPLANGGGVRLFKKAPVGIVFDRAELQGPTKKPKLLRGEEIDEKSKKFKKKLQSIVVEGTDILAAAERACQKSKARLEAKEAAAKEAAKKEEERVAELKKIRGERWLPSIARQMQLQRPRC